MKMLQFGSLALVCAVAGVPALAGQPAVKVVPSVKSIEFVGMPAPSTPEEKTDVYSRAAVKITFKDGRTITHKLKYHTLMTTNQELPGGLVGGLFNSFGQPLTDADGQLASDAPDANSLFAVPGLPSSDPARANGLALVTQFEYRERPPAGQTGSWWSRLPAAMSLARIDQDRTSGALAVTHYDNIDFSGVNGLWIPCAGSLSPWGTHLGSEEYEPDAKTREGLPRSPDTDDATDINTFSEYYFNDRNAAKAYHYGLVPEITVGADGSTSVVKHHALGRIARELVEVMPDNRTVYMGDDGTATGFFMFVADRAGDLSAGTLYSAKWSQTSSAKGGSADLTWIKLGSASDTEIEALVAGGIKFSDIFELATQPTDGFKKVRTYNGTEYLKLKAGMEKAAAFLETRRYAALLGGTTEFTKMEGVSYDAQGGAGFNGKVFVVISRVERTMRKEATAPADDIQLDENLGGAIYEGDLAAGVKDAAGDAIDSAYVARNLASIPELYGGWLGRDAAGREIKDAEGNRCAQDRICGGDNLKFSPRLRTLFIGEDTARRNNNYVFTFNLETRQLARVLSVPRAAEATGLQVVENLNGFAYILSNFQHPGEAEQYGASPEDPVLYPLIDQKWDNRHGSAIGYVGLETGGIPSF